MTLKRNQSNPVRVLRLAVAATLGGCSLAGAQVSVWNNGTGGDWSPGAWTLGTPNSTAVTAVIDGNPGNNVGVIVNGTFNVGTLQVSPGDQVTIPAGGQLRVANSLSSDGVVLASWAGEAGLFADIFHSGGTLTVGGSNVVALSGANARLWGAGTLDNLTRIQGSGQFFGFTVNNTGSVVASSPTDHLFVQPNSGGTFSNDGTLLAQGGTLLIGSGVFKVGSFFRAENDSQIRVTDGADLRDGVITTVSNGSVVVATTSGASMRNIQNNGNITINNQCLLNMSGTFTNSGSVNMNGSANVTRIQLNAGGTFELNGSGVLNMNGGGNIVQGVSGTTFVNNSTIRGDGNIGANVLNIVNNSRITASTPGGTLTLDSLGQTPNTATFFNNGTLLADGGTLQLVGTSADILDNTNGRIIAGSTDIVLTSSAHVRNGTLSSSGTGVIRLVGPANVNLIDVTNAGNITVGNSATLALNGTLLNNGSINLSPAANLATIFVPGAAATGTLAGTGVVNLNAPGATIFGNSGATFVNNSLIQGRGSVGADLIRVTNNATIRATTGDLTLDPLGVIGESSFINNGTLAADGGRLIFQGGTFTNNGAIHVASNGSLQTTSGSDLRGGVILNDGSWEATSSSVTTPIRVRGDGVLSINSSARVQISAGGGTVGTSSVGSLTIAGNGKLDLTDHALAVNYTGSSPLTAVRAQILAAYTSGTWGGNGLTSSSAAAAATTSDKTALGYAEASELFTSFPASFRGVAVDSTTVLVGYSLLGDSNLDLRVDIDDFGNLAAGFNQPGRWFQGDFNYSGTTDIDDFGLLAANFNKVLPADGLLSRSSAVPEPGLMGLVAVLLAGSMNGARRRRG